MRQPAISRGLGSPALSDPSRLKKLAHRASHDVKAPLRNILTLLEFLREDFAGEIPDEAAEMLFDIERQAKKARRLINGVVELIDETLTPPEPSVTNLEAPFRAANGALAPLIAGADVGVDLSDLNGAIVCDKKKFEVLAYHLLSNAVAHRAPGSPLRIRVERLSDGSGFIVCDDGPGIDPHLKARVLEPFERAKGAEAPGGGLGLAVCAEICRQHGWSITLGDDSARGTRLIVRFTP